MDYYPLGRDSRTGPRIASWIGPDKFFSECGSLRIMGADSHIETIRLSPAPSAVSSCFSPLATVRSPLALLLASRKSPVQAFIGRHPVKTLAVAVLPWTSGFGVQRLGSHLTQPLPKFLGHKLWSVIPSASSNRSIM